MSDPRGSVWRKWDLHVHTPDSIVNGYGGTDAWGKFIKALSTLPPEIKVLGINDYIFLDGYKKVITAKKEGKLPNIELILPVVELRLDKFGGSKSGLSRVNFHIIFSDEIDPEIIESQFLGALSSKYVLSPEYDSLRTTGKWAAVPTRKSVEDLGCLIIESVPEAERAKFRAPIVEGFNNLCISLSAVQEALKAHYFNGKFVTAVGKTEWADIKWNDHSIADKKTIINGADLVFIASDSADDFIKARKSLTDGAVNDRLLDCSDAHQYADAGHKDRLGNCLTWIKADPTFEGLRQAVFEYPTRVHVAATPPLEPLLQIKKVRLSFPSATVLKSGEREDVFCFRDERELTFSPYLTCIIGGRGTGKSTLLNLLHEKLEPGSTDFFKQNKLAPSAATVADCVSIDGISEQRVVEFLQQNEIEQFATEHERLTTAIFTRLRKLDTKGSLKEREAEIDAAMAATTAQQNRVKELDQLVGKQSDVKKELITQKGIVESFQNEEYKKINDELSALNRELQALRTGKSKLDRLTRELQTLLQNYSAKGSELDISKNAYEQQVRNIVTAIEQIVRGVSATPELEAARTRERETGERVGALRGELDQFLKARGLSAENLADVGKASERIAELEDDLAELKKRIDVVRAEVGQFSVARKAASDYAEAVGELLAPINIELKAQGAEVKPIELHYRYDMPAFRQAMIQCVTEELGLVEGRAAREDYVEARMKDIDFAALGSQAELLEKIPDDSAVYSKVLKDFFSKPVNFETLKLQAELLLLDVRKFGRIHVLYDGKPVENSSFGQRCTAVIVVLLLLGNMPIVIDEPEAHLDSGLIAKYLVELIKARKTHRQIIFATHNANFVVNGDADLIHCLSMDDDKVTKVVSTTIENLTHRERLLALEGGEKAFQQRERRYGID